MMDRWGKVADNVRLYSKRVRRRVPKKPKVLINWAYPDPAKQPENT